MSRKLSNFRQLSLTCDTPPPPPPRHHQKGRGGLTKQFSEDIAEPSWFERHHHEHEIHQISLNPKLKKPSTVIGDHRGEGKSVKLAWDGDTCNLNEEVIIKKCKEVKRERGKLTRHPSLEKDSILNSKQQELRLKPPVHGKENDKTNSIEIYLAHNTRDCAEDADLPAETFEPKYRQPLIDFGRTDKPFQIKKTGNKKSPFTRSNTVVVVPLVVEKEEEVVAVARQEAEEKRGATGEGINVIIRPMTAQTRREKFRKRANSAFRGGPNEPDFRPPLVRSSSAPSTKQDKGKFLASKRKLKTAKKSPKRDVTCVTNIEAKEWTDAAQPPSEIVTMVSLISPSGSENEAESEDDRERPKSVLKGLAVETSAQQDGQRGGKNVTWRKTAKSVSFQQSSIHAVRSFSASFPARRTSIATMADAPRHDAAAENAGKEKRGTNPGRPDADERVPVKRRLLRSTKEEDDENKPSSSWKKASGQISLPSASKGPRKTAPPGIPVDIQAKSEAKEEREGVIGPDPEENVILIIPEDQRSTISPGKPVEVPASEDTPKEKQCWAMYRKMTEKGINVSYDTILRGMLTPTEYRIRRKTSIAEEMHLMVNPPPTDQAASEEDKPATN